MKNFVIQKQLIPAEFVANDPNWGKRQIWVLRLNNIDNVDEFDTLEEAQQKRNELFNSDPTSRIYKVVQHINGQFIDI